MYAFGAVLFEALTGGVPVEPPAGAEPPAAAAALLVRLPHRPPAWAAGLPRRLARLVDACLHPDPAARPTMADVHRQLVAFQAARRRWRAAAVAAVALAVAGPAVWTVADIVLVGEPDPATPDGRFARGLRRLKAGEVSGAALDFEYVRKTVGDGRAYAYAGYCQLRLDTPKIGADWFQSAIDRGYAPAWVQSDLAYCLTKAGGGRTKAERAVAAAGAAIAAAPDLRAARLARGQARFAFWMANKQNGPADPDLVRDVEAAVAQPGGESRNLFMTAAYVRLAFTTGQEADLARAVHWLREAVRVGVPPHTLANDPFLAQRLGPRADFQQLLKAVPGPVPEDEPDPFRADPPSIAKNS